MILRKRKLAGTAAACALVAALTAGCGGDSSADSGYVNADSTFAPGSSMEKLTKKGKIRIGVQFDQPGIGYRKSEKETPKGFDIEMAKIIAGGLGIKPENIQWVETLNEDREKRLENGTVDLVISTYSITPERRKIVGMAGPYLTTGQQLLVRKGEKISGPKDLTEKQVCSAAGTTSTTRIAKVSEADVVTAPSYSACVQDLLDGKVDAVTTDGALLLGYAAQRPKELKVVGEPFSEENYGIGYPKGDTEMCEFINKTLKHSFQHGDWTHALTNTLWKTMGAVPYPTLDLCE